MEREIGSKRAFDGRLLKVDVVDVELPSGRRSVREIIRHPGAVAVLAETPDGRYVLVRQFRKAVERDLVEVVAGGLAPGESPAACAARELREETGYEAERLTPLGVIAAAPGYTEERLYVFHAMLRPVAAPAQPEEDEDVEPVCVTYREMESLLDGDDLVDGKTIAAWALYNRKMRTFQ